MLKKKKSKDKEPEGAKNKRLRAKVTCLLKKRSRDKKLRKVKEELRKRPKDEKPRERLLEELRAKKKLGKAKEILLKGLGKRLKGEKPEEAKEIGLEEAKKKLREAKNKRPRVTLKLRERLKEEKRLVDTGVYLSSEGALKAVGSRGRLVFVSTNTY